MGAVYTGDRYDPARPALLYTAWPGERNAVKVARSGFALVLRDDGARVQPGPGCKAIDPHTVVCETLRDGRPSPELAGLGIDAGDGDDTVTLPDVRGGAPPVIVRGGAGADSLRGAGTLAGGPGADILVGGPEGDILLGGTGADILRAGAGDDRLVGDGDGDLKAAPDPGGSDDVIDGGAGRDIVLYIGRRDGVRVDLAKRRAGSRRGGEHDRLAGIEDITGGLGGDVLLGDGGANALNGHPGNDTLSGGGGNDSLVGGAGIDKLLGGSGNDTLNSRSSRSSLSGGAGDDVLSASSSRRPPDRFRCGSGSDRVDGAPHGELLDDCERVNLGNVILSARPTRARGALRFGWSCPLSATISCTIELTLRSRARPLARRSVVSSRRRGTLVLRPRRTTRRGDLIDVRAVHSAAFQGDAGTNIRRLRSGARWRVRLG